LRQLRLRLLVLQLIHRQRRGHLHRLRDDVQQSRHVSASLSTFQWPKSSAPLDERQRTGHWSHPELRQEWVKRRRIPAAQMLNHN
jgi:hypothetical protein